MQQAVPASAAARHGLRLMSGKSMNQLPNDLLCREFSVGLRAARFFWRSKRRAEAEGVQALTGHCLSQNHTLDAKRAGHTACVAGP
jgi:hypothetical protein